MLLLSAYPISPQKCNEQLLFRRKSSDQRSDDPAKNKQSKHKAGREGINANALLGAASGPRSDDGWTSVIDFLSDWHWEQDENLRFTMMTDQRIRERTESPGTSPLIGKLR